MKSPTRSPVASPRGRAYDRHSGSGSRGLPKKNGAGAKGVWGTAMDQVGVAILDKKDPNYDSEEEINLPYAPPAPISLREPVPIASAKEGIESTASTPKIVEATPGKSSTTS